MTGEDIVKLRDQLKTTRDPLVTHWDELAELFMPFRLREGTPDILEADRVHDSSGRQAAIILANGLASLIFPREEEWFEFGAPKELEDDDEAVSFYRKATPKVREYLESSNFFEEAQESMIESPVFGTTALFISDLDDTDELFFSNLPIGTYLISEDNRGRVNCVVRELEFTAEQALGEFGEENLPGKVKSKVGKPDGHTQKFRFINAILRNPDREASPYLSVTVLEETKEIVGEPVEFQEFPVAVHRYRKFGRSPWGHGPGTICKGDARQLNFLNELADVATEKDIFPPSVADANLEGEVGQGALEITYVEDLNQAGSIKEWARPGGKYSAFERIQDKRTQLEAAFHVDLFKLFSLRSMERGPLTATEASLIAGEKLSQFSPVFGRIVSEFLDPILNRVFLVLFRAGKLGAPPQSVGRYLNDGTVTGVAKPALRYKNKIVLAMQARENAKLLEFFQYAGPILQIYPEATDALEMGTMVRDVARNGGLVEEWIAPKQKFEERQKQRAQAAQEAVEAAKAEQAAGVAAQLGKAPENLKTAMSEQMLPPRTR